VPDKDETKKPVVPPKPNPNADNKQDRKEPPPKQTASPKPNQAAESKTILIRKDK
jgi:hypothetical protein